MWAVYHMARVEFVEHDEANHRPVAHAGFDSGYIDSRACVAGPGRIMNAVVAQRRRRPHGSTVHCPQHPLEPRLRALAGHGHSRVVATGSVVALPLISEGAPLGVLGIYADEVDAFDTEEVKNLKELAGDLGFGVAALRTPVEQTQQRSSVARKRRTLPSHCGKHRGYDSRFKNMAFKPTYVARPF